MKSQRGYAEVPGLSLATLSISALWHKTLRWYELGHERRLLAGLSDSALKDLGLSRADVEHERVRPFWDDPLQK
ncbi:DUF1127 domain-containing protein [Pseudomonas sp. NFXW11]|uniref:DUF1127 domain-containing protein n=1 Tax=Pseudomonas sp. NFXW11 TaxID=2819531 RepID=UPI003CF92FD3